MASEEGRLYVVEKDDEMTVVRAKGPTAALKHVMQSTYQVRAATADDIALYMTAGGTIEVAGQQEATAEEQSVE